MNVSNEDKAIARAALKAFAGNPRVVKYWDDNNENSIDLLSSIDQPQKNVTSYSTIGLSHHAIATQNDKPLGVELVGVCGTSFSLFSNILATCSFCIINDNYPCFPGAMFHNVVSMYYKNSPMQHILCVSPFLWEKDLQTLNFPSHKVAWLLALPISESECKYAEEHGTDALEDLFEKEQIDIFDLGRKSIL